MLRTNVTCFEWLLILHDYALVCWQDDWVPQYTHRHASVSMLNFRGDRPSVCFRTSSEQTKDGQPCGTIKARGAGGHEITVWNLDHCAIVLGSAGDGKMNETRNCLEANFDPTAVILGDRFATVSAVADNDAYFRFKEEENSWNIITIFKNPFHLFYLRITVLIRSQTSHSIWGNLHRHKNSKCWYVLSWVPQ